MEIIEGNLFDSDAKYIVHQCNCVTTRSKHLAASMFKQFPYANIYAPRKEPDTPGEIIIKGNGDDERYIIALLGQYYPGKVKYPNSTLDGFESRKKYFHSALKKFLKYQVLNQLLFHGGLDVEQQVVIGIFTNLLLRSSQKQLMLKFLSTNLMFDIQT